MAATVATGQSFYWRTSAGPHVLSSPGKAAGSVRTTCTNVSVRGALDSRSLRASKSSPAASDSSAMAWFGGIRARVRAERVEQRVSVEGCEGGGM